MNHTPGPWKAVEARKNEWFISSNDIDIARILHNGKPHPDGMRGMNNTMRANARLIKAAPELLSELRTARNIIALALQNGAWGADSTDEQDNYDEVISALAGFDETIACIEEEK